MVSERIEEQANLLFQELDQLKAREEVNDNYNEQFRVRCINRINDFFLSITDVLEDIECHFLKNEKENTYQNAIVVFDNAPSPIDIELVCKNRQINVPKWFRGVCEKYLKFEFQNGSIESSFFEDNWMLKEVKELRSKMVDYQSENEDLLQVLERFVFSTQKMNLFGDETKEEFNDLKLKGLLMVLIEDFELFGWDIASNIGEDNVDPRFLNVYIKDDIYVNALHPFNKLNENHNLAKVYEIIRNSIHKANQEYLGAIIKQVEPKVHWNFDDVD